MININSGKNQSIMDSCHVLYEYAVFVAKIKKYRDSMELKEAIDLTVRECIEENILRDFLEQHRREVCDMCLTEFDEKKYEDVLREEGREEGLAEGRKTEVFVSVQEVIWSCAGAQKLNLSVEEFEKRNVCGRISNPGRRYKGRSCGRTKKNVPMERKLYLRSLKSVSIRFIAECWHFLYYIFCFALLSKFDILHYKWFLIFVTCQSLIC